MRRTVPAIALGALCAVALTACGAGTPVDERRAVGSFSALEVSGGVDVRVAHGPAPAVTVDAGEAVIDRVVTRVRGGVLHIGVRDRGIVIGRDPLRGARVRVTLPRLHDVTVDGSSDVDVSGLRARSLAFHMHGGGDVTAHGRVRSLDADITGSGDARLAGLSARTAHVVVSGPADVDLSVSDSLAIEVDGPGDVTYRGNPRVTQQITGPADISHIGP
jgi:hypothetical protein